MGRVFRLIALLGAIGSIAYGLTAGSEWSDQTWLQALGIAGLLLLFAGWPGGTGGYSTFNRTTLRLASIMLVAFALLSVQLVRVQIVQSSRTLDRQQLTPGGQVVQNPRDQLAEDPRLRGSIFDRNGIVLAEQVSGGGDTVRVFPEPSTWGLLGYYSPSLYGAAGIEAAYGEELAGRRGGNPIEIWLDEMLNRERGGHDLHLTVDVALQRQAVDLLAGRNGAVVLMDAATGELLVITGTPAYDPNLLYTDADSPEENLAGASAYWRELLSREDGPFVFRPASGLYVPGSTFKMVTASALLDTGLASPETFYRDEGVFEVDGRVIIEQNRPDESKVDWTLEESFAFSLNVVFARIGLELGADVLTDYAARFGIGEAPPIGIASSPSQITGESDLASSRTLVADTAFGQGELLVTPLQMALIGAAIANGGEIMVPTVVASIVDASGEVVERTQPSRWKRPMSQETAEAMEQLMVASASYGYASGAQIDGLTVGGKTGTAEVASGDPHAWFVGYASDGDRTLVAAVIVENAGSGSVAALPIGRNLLASAFGR